MSDNNNNNVGGVIMITAIFAVMIISVMLVIAAIVVMTERLWRYTNNLLVVTSWLAINAWYWGYWFHLNFHILPPKTPWSLGDGFPFYLVAVVGYLIGLLVAINTYEERNKIKANDIALAATVEPSKVSVIEYYDADYD